MIGLQYYRLLLQATLCRPANFGVPLWLSTGPVIQQKVCPCS